MEAIVSGTAGLAIILDGDAVWELAAAGDAQSVIRRSRTDVHQMLAQAQDWTPLECAGLESVRAELRLARSAVECLQVALILLDPGSSQTAVGLAVEDLASSIVDTDVCNRVEDVLFSIPLPKKFDVGLALARTTSTSNSSQSADFFRRLETNQNAIDSVSRAWELAAYEHLASDEMRALARSLLAREGAFGGLVRNWDSLAPATLTASFRRFATHRHLQFEGVQKCISAFVANIQSSHPVLSGLPNRQVERKEESAAGADASPIPHAPNAASASEPTEQRGTIPAPGIGHASESPRVARPIFSRRHDDLAGAFQRLADAGLIALAQFLACGLYREDWRFPMTSATLLGVLVFGFAAEFGGLYRPWRTESLSRETAEVFLSWLSVPLALAGYGFITRTSADYPRVTSFVWFGLAPVLMCGLRTSVRLVLHVARTRGYNLRRVAIVGATPEAERLAQVLEESPWLGLQLVGIFDDRGADRRHPIDRADCRVLGGFADLVRCAREGVIDIVYVALPMRAEMRYATLLRALADTAVSAYVIADLFSYAMVHAQWGQVGGIPVVSTRQTPFEGVVGWFKRMEDMVIGLLILVVSAVPMLVIALLVKLSSKGPVFFRQRRYGLNGKPIRVLKFRTMTVCEDGPYIKQVEENDPRITPIGRWLRRWSLDELPQFLQVMTGELSIVGPQPHFSVHDEQYRQLIGGYFLRHKVKPGITGWAQVNGWRGETADLTIIEKRVRHDREYIEKWSFRLEIKIILWAILLALFGQTKRRGAW